MNKLILTILLSSVFFAIHAQKPVKQQKNSSSIILKAEKFKHYVDYFNRMEDENITQAIPNAQSWDWMQANIPLFECPQDNFEEIYYYRWWTLRKHINKTPVGYAFTEFLVPRNYADKYNLISSALGHHIMEARWLKDTTYINNDIRVWYRGNGGKPMKRLRAYSNWAIFSAYNKFMVDGNKDFITNYLSDFENEYKGWEGEKRNNSGLFWQFDVRDAMEETISGGRKEKNPRPSINSYMFGNAMAISAIAKLANKDDVSSLYKQKADTIKHLVQQKLWNSDSLFFEVLKETGNPANVREAIGFLPWYVNLPDSGYEIAWKQVTDTRGFMAPFGLTTAERRHPEFRTHGCCKCEWDGAIWPFATSQTLTALGNLLNNYKQTYISDSAYFRLMELYVESQYYRGRPYIGEYLDETTGYWLKGDQERSRYYNHSTFCDLIITGIIGLRPRPDNIIEVNPLIPQEKWDWFCLDNVKYHGQTLSILWDKTGEHYGKGKGFHLFVNGKKVASSNTLNRLITKEL
jgi:hypothetical protein